MFLRRNLLTSVPALLVGASLRANASEAAVSIVASGHAVGALVEAIGGTTVRVQIDRSLPATQLRVGASKTVDIAARVMLKGDGIARTRFLDDARNATTTAANIRDALIAAAPAFADRFRNNHRAWSRPFARQVLRWTQQLGRSTLHRQRVVDTYHRIYLLEWAGATIADQDATAPSPAALGQLPAEPAVATGQAYGEYVAKLVAAIH